MKEESREGEQEGIKLKKIDVLYRSKEEMTEGIGAQWNSKRKRDENWKDNRRKEMALQAQRRRNIQKGGNQYKDTEGINIKIWRECFIYYSTPLIILCTVWNLPFDS